MDGTVVLHVSKLDLRDVNGFVLVILVHATCYCRRRGNSRRDSCTLH